MLFSTDIRERIEEDFNKVVPFLGDKRDEIIDGIKNIDEEKQLAMKFLYGSMPFSDIGDYDFLLFYSYVKHAFYLQDHMEWCANVPVEYFLHYILYHRVNSENIEDCRYIFYEELLKRVEGMSMQEAVLEVNNWCLQQATYKTTDGRTASPLTLCRSGEGRCGEEATLLTVALRSIGIPARDTFSPWWAHCDDNHAWVEVWCDGSWYFTGACEPEAVLNKGWFTAPASRAMQILSRLFSDIGMEKEKIYHTPEGAIYLNSLEIYAKCKEFTVEVTDEKQNPVQGAKVSFQVVNYSNLGTLISLYTDEFGHATITTGYGGLRVEVSKDSRMVNRYVNTKSEDVIAIILDSQPYEQDTWEDFLLEAPKEGEPVYKAFSDALRIAQEDRNARSSTIRNQRVAGCYNKEYAEQFQEFIGITKALKGAKGNFEEIRTLLKEDIIGVNTDWKSRLLEVLSEKDYTDVSAELLAQHLKLTLPLHKNLKEDVFAKYVLCPRISFERLTSYRGFITKYFTEEEKTSFCQNPENLWKYINDIVKVNTMRERKGAITSPEGVLRLKIGNSISKKVLFVAILRTLGIPAQLHRSDESIRYYDYVNDSFVALEDNGGQREEGILSLHSIKDMVPSYKQQWFLNYKDLDGYRNLQLAHVPWKGTTWTQQLAVGEYRLILSNRLADGSNLGRTMSFMISPNATKEIEVSIPELKQEQLFVDFKLTEFECIDSSRRIWAASELTKNVVQVMIWLEPGSEPTEHILNELLEHKDTVSIQEIKLNFMVKNQVAVNNVLLQKVIKEYQNSEIYTTHFTELESVYEMAGLKGHKLPVVIATRGGLNGIYGVSGYQVGTISMVIKIVEQAKRNEAKEKDN